jgi:hypothetical protein
MEVTRMNYDPLADLIQVAEDCCADHGQISKAAALQNLQTVLRANPELSGRFCPETRGIPSASYR